MNADSNLCPQVYWQLLQYFILSYDLLVDVKMLVPVVDTLSKLFANMMAAQVRLHLIEKKKSLIFCKIIEISTAKDVIEQEAISHLDLSVLNITRKCKKNTVRKKTDALPTY